MISIFMVGAIGFLCYEVMRFYVVYHDGRFKEFLFGGALGFAVRVAACLVAGVAGLVANLDVAMAFDFSGPVEFDQKLIACYLRAWGIGIAGPASISKWDAGAGVKEGKGSGGPVRGTLDTLDGDSHMRQPRMDLGFILRRLFLR